MRTKALKVTQVRMVIQAIKAIKAKKDLKETLHQKHHHLYLHLVFHRPSNLLREVPEGPEVLQTVQVDL